MTECKMILNIAVRLYRSNTIEDVLDLVKHGIITESQGQSLIEEYKRHSEANRTVRKQLLTRKQKTLRRQDTMQKT